MRNQELLSVQVESLVEESSDAKLEPSGLSLFEDSFEELASAAQKKHDELQVKYNTEAHSSAAGYSGVTQVQEI